MGSTRITILDTGDISNPVGGQATFCRAIAPHLAGQVTFWGALPNGVTQLRCAGTAEQGGTEVTTRSLARPRKAGVRRVVPDRIACLWGALLNRRKIMAESDVIYVQSPELGLPFIIGKRRVPLVLHLHGAGNPANHARYVWARTKAGRAIYERVMKRVVREVDIVLSVDARGVELATSWRDDSSSPPRLVPSCYESGLYFLRPSGANEQVADVPLQRRIVFVGRLEEAKGVQRLIAALSSGTDTLEHVTLAVVGDGSYRSVLETAAASLPDSVTVEFLGWLGRDEVAAQLRMADLMVLPSAQEGLPISILECLACGVPVVACDVGDISVVVRDGENGYLLGGCETSSLASAMGAALARDWDSEAIAASVCQYGCEHVASLVRSLLEQLAGGAPAMIATRDEGVQV